MMVTILQVVIFLLILLTYSIILESLTMLIAVTRTVSIQALSKILNRQLSLSLETNYRVNNFIKILLSLAFSVWFWLGHLWNASWLKLWESPLLVAALFLGLLYAAANTSTYNPFIRSEASGALVIPWISICLLLIGLFAPAYIRPITFQAGVAVAGPFEILISVYALLGLSKSLKSFQGLDRRHDALGEALKRVERVADLIGDAESWKTIRESIANVNKWYSEILGALREKRLQKADNLLIQAELEIRQLEQILSDQKRSYLPDELRTRLQQATVDIKSLQEEFEVEGLSAGNLQHLSAQVSSLITGLENLNPDSENFFDQLEPFDQLFHEIDDIRAALRFRQNVDTIIKSLNDEVEAKGIIIQVAQNLGLDIETAKASRQEVIRTLNEFQSGPISKSETLVEAYQSVQKALSDFRASVEALAAEINRNWNQQTSDSKLLTIYTPKSCFTDYEVQGAISFQFNGTSRKSVSIDLDSASLDIQKDRTIEVKPMGGKTYGVTSFSFVGKRGGHSTLAIRVKDMENDSYSFSIRVKPSVSEMARDALVFGAPIGGLAILVLWYLKVDIKDAATIGGAIGGAIALLIFFISYIRYRRNP